MNNYIFIRVVGKGSYGEVNLVKHKTDRKQYVIKKLNLTTSTKRERRSAEQEAQLLSQLRHPNIVTYRESWEGDDRQLYIVMGFCEGGDLYHRLKQQKGELLPERQVVEWFVQIAMALQYLHERNILHRDLKTQNIFLTKTNIIKVGDLGIARVLENQNDMASTLIGTPYYMSPELFSNKLYNHKSDVWALGCCVYEMSTLKHAFNAKDMNSLVYRIVEGKLPQMPSRYDPQLGDLIKSMLCKKPEDRPDVKLILRQPYIKRQIAMFLEATKEKTAKSRKKAVSGSGDCRANSASPVSSAQPKPERQPPSPQPEPSARVKRQDKASNGITDSTPVQTPPPAKPSSPDALKCSLASLATVSNINIDMQPQEDEDVSKRLVQRPQLVLSQHCTGDDHVTHSVHKDSKGKGKPDPSPARSPLSPLGRLYQKQMSDVDDKDDTMELLHEANMQNPEPEVEKVSVFPAPERRPAHKSNIESISVVVEMNMDSKNDTVTLLKGAPIQHTSDIQDDLESTEKLLEPLPLTQDPDQEETCPPLSKPGPTPQFSSEPSMSQQNKVRDIKLTHGDQTKNRPLSARERRRLRQSQENAGQPGAGAVRRASYDVTSTNAEHYNGAISRSVSDSYSYSVTAANSKQDKLLERKSDDEECSSSTSSTERSEGDCRERKTEFSDMQDLVHMMTQTLRMDAGDGVTEVDKGRCGSTALPEFRINRKYRDTLVLHGKAREEAENLSLGEIPIGSTSGPAKVRRAIEQLRTDVVKGLGVKLLDKVLEIMEEEDDTKRELCLRDQMGDEKYQAYAVMVRQLKFFEDMAFKI
ncbi:hypothetical protein INR49_031053 [Caranx melampygus]|nr:hypothetical protein INR49_031053 [Caranx melampygus]